MFPDSVPANYENVLLMIADFFFGRSILARMISLFPLRLRENRQRKVGDTLFYLILQKEKDPSKK
jgi:hypothetical protein